jgi:hypothetical protein
VLLDGGDCPQVRVPGAYLSASGQRWNEVVQMARVDDAVNNRLAEAEDLLTGLAVPGSEAHAALLALESSRRAGRTPSEAVLLGAIAAITGQAGLSLRAGRRAGSTGESNAEGRHWLVTTAGEWQRYLGWLVTTRASMTEEISRMPEAARRTLSHAWAQAADECAAARQLWAAVVAEPVEPSQDQPIAAVDVDQLDSVVLNGRVYVCVEDLTGSLRGRARAFSDAALVVAADGDEPGARLSEAVAEELGSRADALDVAGIAHASSCDPHRID